MARFAESPPAAVDPREGSEGSPHLSFIPKAKVTPPAAPLNEVPRATLWSKVAEAGPVPLLLVNAPAGFGKTNTMTQLCERFTARGNKIAWLTLDRANNDAARFLSCLAAAVSSWGNKLTAADALFNVMELLTSSHHPFTLFLDDFETIHEPSVLALVRTIIEYLPHGSQVVIGTRRLPELNLARLRARGRLLEVGIDDLRFTLEESAQYFQLRKQKMSFENLSRLHSKAEGWIAALWLASLSLERHGTSGDFVERFSGSNRALAAYLVEDVLGHQPPEVREFLLRTSILRQLEPSLCQALMPGIDADRILKVLADQNLFLISVPGEVPSYRYHGLFSAFLLGRLRAERPDELRQLHLDASSWYQSCNRPVPAIDHMIEAEDFPHALALLDIHAQSFLEAGRMRLLTNWFDAIPDHAMRGHPVLQAVAIWSSLLTRGPWQPGLELKRSRSAASQDPEVMAHVNAQQVVILGIQDRYDEARAVGAASLARLPTRSAFADTVLRNAMAHVFTVMGENKAAQSLIDAARHALGGSTFNRMYAESLEGILDFQGGRLRQATAQFRIAVSATRAATNNYTSGNAWAGVLYAGALYEANETERAEHLINVYLPLACDVGLPDHMINGHVIRARIAFARGDTDKAFETLTTLEQIGCHRQLMRVVAAAKLERSRMLLLQGNAEASKEELDRADHPAVWERVRVQRLSAHELNYLTMARLRWEIHFGDARATIPALQAEIAEASTQNRHRRALGLRLLLSLAQQRAGDPTSAIKTISHVLRQASPEGSIRFILDEGNEIGRLVHRFSKMLQENPAKRSDPFLKKYLNWLLEAFGPEVSDDETASVHNPLMEPLTRKEIQVLQLAAEGCSNRSLTNKLTRSESTVRTHLRNINTKLNARSRAEAVAIGRRLGLIQ